ncbi:hypothetical protein [Pseudothermotoga elfii]
MKRIWLVFLLIPLSCFAATVNLDFAPGSAQWFGFTLLPHIEFWKVQADLVFTGGVVSDSKEPVLFPLLKPFDSLKYLSLDFDTSGVKFSMPDMSWLRYSNVDYEPYTTSLWAFNGAIGGVVQEDYSIFFRSGYFSISLSNNGSYHLGVPLKFYNFELEPFVSNYGYGLEIVYQNALIFVIPNVGMRFALALNRMYFFLQYMEFETKIGFGWFNKDEWIIATNESIDFRKKILDIYLIAKFEKERWYAGLSFPVFW